MRGGASQNPAQQRLVYKDHDNRQGVERQSGPAEHLRTWHTVSSVILVSFPPLLGEVENQPLDHVRICIFTPGLSHSPTPSPTSGPSESLPYLRAQHRLEREPLHVAEPPPPRRSGPQSTPAGRHSGTCVKSTCGTEGERAGGARERRTSERGRGVRRRAGGARERRTSGCSCPAWQGARPGARHGEPWAAGGREQPVRRDTPPPP